MVGANYMGGRRNAARAQFKDANGKAQRGHFVKKRHQLLTQALRDGYSHESESAKLLQAQKREEIPFAHAQRDMNHGSRPLIERRPPLVPFHDVETDHRGEEKKRVSRSKFLESLDIDYPSGLRATMDKLLNLPDLAGISNMRHRPLTTKHEQKILDVDDMPRKRQRTESYGSEGRSENLQSISPRSSPERTLVQPQGTASVSQKNPIGMEMLDHGDDFVAESLILSSSMSPDYRKTTDHQSSSDRFSTMLECGTPNDSGFSELSFSDDYSSAVNPSSPMQPISDHSPCFSASSLDQKSRFKVASPNSLPVSNSSNSSRAPVLSIAVPKRPTFTPRSISARSALPTYSSSPLLSSNSCKRSSPRQPSDYTSGDSNANEKIISLLEVPDPWRYLDDVLGLHSSCSGVDKSTLSIHQDSRTGLGHKAPQQAFQNTLPHYNPFTNTNESLAPENASEEDKTLIKDESIQAASYELDTDQPEHPSKSFDEQIDNRSSPLSIISARDILPMKRHILSSATLAKRSREPFLTSGTVTSVFSPSTPYTPTKSTTPANAFSSAYSSPASDFDKLSYSSKRIELSKHRQLFSSSPEPSVSATVREMLIPYKQPAADSKNDILNIRPSPQVRLSLPDKDLSSPTRGISQPHYDLIRGPNLFSDMEEDED